MIGMMSLTNINILKVKFSKHMSYMAKREWACFGMVFSGWSNIFKFDDNDDDLAQVLFKKMGVKSDLLASEDFLGHSIIFHGGSGWHFAKIHYRGSEIRITWFGFCNQYAHIIS